MIRARHRATRAVAAALGVAILVSGCGQMSRFRWPWSDRPELGPEIARELVVTSNGAASGAYPQYWKRNALIVDLRNVAGQGSLALRPREGGRWPVRMAFRVTPGAIGMLEVAADQRMLIPVTSEGTQLVDLELVPGVYSADTAEMTVTWHPPTPR